ncbi:MAG: hypothetical protein JWQ66_2539 [Mucilaginibacter sp.]|nr:hypothetical protein [Mucilaginibacter sp.]
MLKNQIKKALNLFGYQVRKNHVEDPDAVELREFIHRVNWFKNYGINTIVDIGANEGQFAKKIVTLFPNACLFCFEPLGEPFHKLEETFKDNKNVILYHFALGEIDGELTINLNEYSPSSSFLKMDESHKDSFSYAVATTTSKVQVKHLDGLELNLVEPILIKIDVQGFEDKVIAGGMAAIKRAKVIIIEVSFKELYEKQPLFIDIYRTLTQLNFRYHGNLEQLLSPHNGEILQADAIFINNI